MIPLPIIAALVAGAIGAAGAWTFQAARYGEQIATMQRDQALAAHKQLEQAHAQTIALQAKADTAAKQHAARASTLANAAALAGSELDGLRGDLAALRESVNTVTPGDQSAISGLLAECARKYQGMAAEADKRSSEVILLLDAWPR